MVDRDFRAGDREWALEESNNARKTVMEGEDEEISHNLPLLFTFPLSNSCVGTGEIAQ